MIKSAKNGTLVYDLYQQKSQPGNEELIFDVGKAQDIGFRLLHEGKNFKMVFFMGASFFEEITQFACANLLSFKNRFHKDF